jgi:hypothetical protein
LDPRQTTLQSLTIDVPRPHHYIPCSIANHQTPAVVFQLALHSFFDASVRWSHSDNTSSVNSASQAPESLKHQLARLSAISRLFSPSRRIP